MRGFLIVFASHDGQTARIAERIAAAFRAASVPVCVVSSRRRDLPDPAGYDGVVAGSCVRYGRHDRRLVDYLAAHSAALRDTAFGLFSVDLIARDAARARPDGNVYARKLLQRLPLRPDAFAIFAGRLDYPRYRWYDRLMIRAIMRATGGPTDPSSVIEYTDWDAVDRFADRMRKLSSERPRATETE